MKVSLVCISVLLVFAVPAPCQSATPSAELTQHAQSGDAQAQFEVGRAYEAGKGVQQDDERAVEWFRKSADQGNAQAQNSLGVMYALGRGVKRDKEEAVRWYKKAARQGSAEGIYNVAISYYNGEGVGEDVVAAYAWMMVAQRKGDPQAGEALKHIGEQLNNRVDRSKFNLARLYEKGEDIPQDMPAAVTLYIELAQPKEFSWYASESQYKLCQLYAAGEGVPQDYALAKSWCKKSQKAFAYEVLGRMAEKGMGQEKNLREAIDFYKSAAAREVPDGYLDTGRLEMEIGSHEGEKNAYFWYYLAARRKIPGADQKLQEAAAHLNDKEIAEQQKGAAAWLKLVLVERERNLKKH
jgi:TPR repeat protein